MATALQNDNRSTDSESEVSESTESDSNEPSALSTPPKKKIKRLCRFLSTWETEFTWCRQVPGNQFKAQCTLCHTRFSISHGGRNDLTSHATTGLHVRNTKPAKCSDVRSFFVKSTPTGIDKQVRTSHISQ